MPQTDPFHALTPSRKLSDTELARAIRLDMEAELDAINLYASHLDATDNELAKRVIEHVMNEEKEHAMLFLELPKVLDPDQASEAAKAGPKFALLAAGASDEAVEAVGEGKADGKPESVADLAPERARAALTIGTLRK